MRFFAFHFLLPFAILGFVGVHLMFLHITGSTNPLGVNRNFFKIRFHPFFRYKDFLVLMMLTTILMVVVFFYP
jgi:ubiquinol-cytochrome c reductase cytochrome b subunit